MLRHSFQSLWLVLVGLFAAFAAASCGQTNSFDIHKPAPDSVQSQAQPAKKVYSKKIVAFGDSLTIGLGLTEKESYPSLLQAKLEADGFDYEIVNAGVSGDTTAGGLNRIDWSLNQPNVEILILELGANDMLRGLPVDQMKTNLSEIIRRAQAKNVRVLLCGMYASTSMGADYQREFTKAYKDLATEHKVAFLPFFLEGVGGIAKLNQADGIHPNAEGAQIIANTVYKQLRPLLKK